MARLYTQVVSRGSDSKARELTSRPTTRVVRLCVLCIGLVVPLVGFWSVPVTAQPTDPNRAEVGSSQTHELSRTLADLIRQLREIRSDYYLRKAKDEAELKRARRNSETLRTDLDELRKQEADLDQQIQQYESEVDDLRERLLVRSALHKVIREQIQPFYLGQSSAIENGAPYKQQDRIARLKTACQEGSDANSVSVADQLGRVWSYAQEELRLARSSETYTARVASKDGAAPHARYFRVGQLILGYVTEDGQQTGIWSALSDRRGWSLISDPKQTNQVRDAIEILDRRQAPRFLMLPVAIQSADTAGRGRQ